MDSSALALNVPKHKTGDIELKAVELTDATADILDGLSGIYSEYEKSGKKEELSYVPIMLLQVGAAASIDPRLINREAPDDPESVVNQAAREIVSIYEETKEKKSTQLAFLDRYNRMDTSALDKVKKGGMSAYRPVYEDADAAEYGTEQKEEEEAVQHWDLYSDIKRKLVEAGIPAHEVAAVNQAKTDEERREMFDKVNRGELRVVIGSTQKLGTGVNVQQKLYAVHHIDPARDLTPASMRQRNGRVLRDGNENSEVRVIYYGMKDTVTPGIIDRLRRKSGFIGQVFSGKGMGMEFEDAVELNLESMKSALVSDKRQLQRAELIGELRDAKMKEEMAAERMRSEYKMGSARSARS
jgi:superfamily II DNA or RNA helicase